jgi:hypothetical protein
MVNQFTFLPGFERNDFSQMSKGFLSERITALDAILAGTSCKIARS